MTRRSAGSIVAAALIAAMLFAGFVALGVWQVQRRAWKHDLIAQVDARAHAMPVAAPGPAAWPAITVGTDAYRRVRLSGRYANDRETLVRAATTLGSGYWVMTPLATDAGFTVLVNRGYVSPKRRVDHAKPEGTVTVTGYLRLSEPRGGFLRRNDAARDAWYSRDVAAIAAARGLGRVAPYFIDADRSGDGMPVGGLTRIAFPDNHMIYLLTWFALAGLTLVAFVVFVRHDARMDAR